MSAADRDGRGMDYLRPFLPGLESVLEDEDVSEIMINGPANVWVERLGEIREHPAPGLDAVALGRAAIQIARPLGLDPATAPILDARLDDGSRVAICVPPAAPHVAITIRRFGKRNYSHEDLVRFGSLPQEVLDEAAPRSWGGETSSCRAEQARVRPRCSMPSSSCSRPTTALFPSRTPWNSGSTGKTVSASRREESTANR